MKTSLFSRWKGMMQRCFKPEHQAYKNYGARGISVCDEWCGIEGFDNFALWAFASGFKEELFLERVNNNLGYTPENCKWATRKEQNRNTRLTIRVEGKLLIEVVEETGLPYKTLHRRVRYLGVTTIDQLTRPLKAGSKLVRTSPYSLDYQRRLKRKALLAAEEANK